MPPVSATLECVTNPAVPEAEPGPAEPAAPAKKRRWTLFSREKAPPRPVLIRLFGVSLWGAFKLALLCVVVGFFVLASQFDPRDPDVDMGSMIAGMARSAWEAAGWSVRNFWKPALAGAGLVLPVWVLWRLLSLPFRK